MVKAFIDLKSKRKRFKQIAVEDVHPRVLRESLLLGLAKEMGQELHALRGDVLRRSAALKPSRDCIEQPEYIEPHNRGEVLVAAMMNAFLQVWSNRLDSLGEVSARVPGPRARHRRGR